MKLLLLFLFVDEIVELWLEWCCDMIVMINYAIGVRDYMSLFMFGVLLLCFGENSELSWIVVLMIFNE